MNHDRIANAAQLFLNILKSEAPVCPICNERTVLEDDLVKIGYDEEEDYEDTLWVTFSCEQCQQTRINISMLTLGGPEEESLT